MLFKWYCLLWSKQLYLRHKVLAPQLLGMIRAVSVLEAWSVLIHFTWWHNIHVIEMEGICTHCLVSLLNIELNGELSPSLPTVCGVHRNQTKLKVDARTAVSFVIWETLCAVAKKSGNWIKHTDVRGFEQQPHVLPPVLCGCKGCYFEIINATSFVGVDYMLADEWSLECGTCISAWWISQNHQLQKKGAILATNTVHSGPLICKLS